MKYKYKPEDFIVIEHLKDGILLPNGNFRVFLLKKKHKETFEVLEKLRKFWGLSSRDIGIAGIKDKNAYTFQYLSVPQRIHRIPKDKGFSLRFVGYSQTHLSSQSLLANEFSLVLREISDQEKSLVENRLHILKQIGMPNYFDDQRFGSYENNQWTGKYLFLGHMEKVLQSFVHTHAPKRLSKKLLQEWGNWKTCLFLCQADKWQPGVRVFSFLSHEGHEKGFRHAVGLLDHRYLLMIANAYLSFLFNKSLSLRLQNKIGVFLSSKCGKVFFPLEKPDIPKEGWIVAYDTPEADSSIKEVLKEEGLSLNDLKIRGIYGVTIHAKKRALWIYPNFTKVQWEKDEIFSDFWKLSLQVFLPPGSYATWILKFLSFSEDTKYR